MDWRTKLERGGAGVLHLRPSRDQVAGDLSERRTLDQRHCPRVEEAALPRRRANKSQLLRHFSHWPCSISSVGGSKWSSARSEGRPGGAVQEGEE
jgi:hypothetical protein